MILSLKTGKSKNCFWILINGIIECHFLPLFKCHFLPLLPLLNATFATFIYSNLRAFNYFKKYTRT